MLQPRSKPKWWLPLLILFVPGSCYLYAAFFPGFRLDFAILGAVIMVANVLLATWRFLDSRQTDNHTFRLFAAQGFTLAALLISIRFWMAYLHTHTLFIDIALLFIYIMVWFFPSYAPSTAQRLYRELWFPKNKLMRFLSTIALAIGGGAGALGASIGKNLLHLGDVTWLIMAIITTIALVGGTFYLSTSLWRQQRGLHPIPAADE
jgi:hypothetical protein